VSPLITIQFSSPKLASSFKFSTKSSAQPPSGLPLPSSPMLPSSSMLPNQPLPIHWPNGFPSSGVFLFLFTSSPLPPQTPTLWPTQVPSWVSFFLFLLLHYWFNIYVVAARVCRSPDSWVWTDLYRACPSIPRSASHSRQHH
jgi:hypothetical protein